MEKFIVNQSNNFMRIFRLPLEYPSDFCFGGGHPVNFQLVDWFNPVEMKFWERGKRDFILKGTELEEHRMRIREFIKGKMYYIVGYKYLAIADYGDTFLI